MNTCDGVDVIVLTGNFGTLAPPRLISFVADDPDDLDDIYSAGDTFTLGLNMRTDALTIGVGSWGLEHPAHGDRAYVDNLFSFSLSLGADYSPSPSPNLDPNTNTNLTLTLTLTLTLILTLTLTLTLNLSLILSLILSLTRCRLFGRLARCVDLRRNRHRRERRGHAKLCRGLCGHTQLDNGRPVRARPAHQRYAPGA